MQEWPGRKERDVRRDVRLLALADFAADGVALEPGRVKLAAVAVREFVDVARRREGVDPLVHIEAPRAERTRDADRMVDLLFPVAAPPDDREDPREQRDRRDESAEQHAVVPFPQHVKHGADENHIRDGEQVDEPPLDVRARDGGESVQDEAVAITHVLLAVLAQFRGREAVLLQPLLGHLRARDSVPHHEPRADALPVSIAGDVQR